jgi:hypothetical protein
MPGGERVAALLGVTLLVGGCGRASYYEDGQGFHIAPPPSWVERERSGSAPPVSGRVHTKGGANLPLPPIGSVGGATQRLLVRYERTTAGRLAWLRVSSAEAPPSMPLEECAAAHSPRSDWQQEGEAENLQVASQPAVRVVFKGQWAGQDYLSETVAVRKGAGVYFFTASFPASDESARTEARQAIAAATWK